MKDPEDDKELLNVELGNKMVLLMDILKESYLIGDKVLVFSQSLLSLDLIEKFLSVAAYDDTYGTWNHGKDYFRMDGSTGKNYMLFFEKCSILQILPLIFHHFFPNWHIH